MNKFEESRIFNTVIQNPMRDVSPLQSVNGKKIRALMRTPNLKETKEKFSNTEVLKQKRKTPLLD